MIQERKQVNFKLNTTPKQYRKMNETKLQQQFVNNDNVTGIQTSQLYF